MKPYYQDNHIELYAKDCRQMAELADNSVQCVVTSPPYWGLRKYSGEQELVWGDNHCEHQWNATPARRSRKASDIVKLNSKEATVGGNLGLELPSTNTCSLCGAWKGAYGLEPTPEMYVQHTIEILREIRRVLRKDGVVFWNIGDSYNSHIGDVRKVGGFQGKAIANNPAMAKSVFTGYKAKHPYLKDKDLCLIPFRIAIAAQEDGWWVRSVIIWSKSNPMPESVTDRPTESHEYILMLTKSARYYWDADAVREVTTTFDYSERNRDITKLNNTPGRTRMGGLKTNQYHNRNIRTVWEFPTQPYPEAHFAVFPEKLPELCIKAATPEVGCCSKCGAPCERLSERQTSDTRPGRNTGGGKSGTTSDPNQSLHTSDLSKYRQQISYETVGWQPTCKCNADKVPSIVLDPFAGAGTTLWVAKKLNRQSVGYEISEEYCQLALERNRQQVLI